MINENIKKASELIKNGWVVAFPTETVYWLWANIYNRDAIKRIFEIKWRASDNPLIVHISSIDELENIVSEIPDIVYTLAEKFWPWPLTFVLKKKDNVISEVSAWWDTIGVRIPNNPLALELIKLANVPIAAPSANLSWKPSPTSASHVRDDLWDRVDFILDWWDTNVWVESTVIDLTVNPVILLRPGWVSFEELKKYIPNIQLHPNLVWENNSVIAKSPWMKYRHYSPDTELVLFDYLNWNINSFLQENKNAWKKIWVITTNENQDKYKWVDKIFLLWSIYDMNWISKNLFNVLRQVDKYWLDIVFCESFEEKGIGLAIMDRLKRACKK